MNSVEKEYEELLQETEQDIERYNISRKLEKSESETEEIENVSEELKKNFDIEDFKSEEFEMEFDGEVVKIKLKTPIKRISGEVINQVVYDVSKITPKVIIQVENLRNRMENASCRSIIPRGKDLQFTSLVLGKVTNLSYEELFELPTGIFMTLNNFVDLFLTGC